MRIPGRPPVYEVSTFSLVPFHAGSIFISPIHTFSGGAGADTTQWTCTEHMAVEFQKPYFTFIDINYGPFSPHP